jgi:hypothetical protein
MTRQSPTVGRGVDRTDEPRSKSTIVDSTPQRISWRPPTSDEPPAPGFHHDASTSPNHCCGVERRTRLVPGVERREFVEAHPCKRIGIVRFGGRMFCAICIVRVLHEMGEAVSGKAGT